MLWLGEAAPLQPTLSCLLPGAALSPPCAPNFASRGSCSSAGGPLRAMYRRMLRCGAELGSPGGSGGSGGGGAGGRLARLWMVPLTLSGLLGVAWGASSLGAHHIHHFHGSSKHHSVPIAIYRSPASLRGGHGGSEMPSSQGVGCSLPPSFPTPSAPRFSAPKA